MKPGNQFTEVHSLIVLARERVFRTVNKELIDLYWNVGQYLSEQVGKQGWGKGVVKELSTFLSRKEPGLKGFSAQNLWRMKQFYEQYSNNEKLSPLVRELTWTNNMVILSRIKDETEREFYLRMAAREKLSKRKLERAIDASTFERSVLAEQKLSPLVRELNPDISLICKDTYVLEFLGLKDDHSENDLQKAI